MTYRSFDARTRARRVAALRRKRRRQERVVRGLEGQLRWRRTRAGRTAAACLAVVLGLAFLGERVIADRPSNLARADEVAMAVQLTRFKLGKEVCPSVVDLQRYGYLPAGAPLRDTWGHDFHVRCDLAHSDAVSAGEDGIFGTRDDVVH